MQTGVLATRRGTLIGLAAALGACGQSAAPVTPPIAAEVGPANACGNDGRLQTELYGALAGSLDWSAADLECSGMPRPNGEGARMRFAGRVQDGSRRLAIIIAIPALKRAATGVELASKVTLIDEGSGRFFSTWDLDGCWTDVTSLRSLDDSGDRFTIGGMLYCVAPLAEVNGDSSVSIDELTFAGLLDWSAK